MGKQGQRFGQVLAMLADDLLGLVYPRLCAACGKEHPLRGQCLCISCRLTLPLTDYHTVPANGMQRRLEGRFPIEGATAMFYFLKDSPVQELLHRIKYGGQKEAARDLGRHYGYLLREQALYQSVEAIVPVPLHPRREHQRGFNQSAWFGRGLAEAMEVTCLEKALVRIKATRTQTAMNRQARLDNMEGAFHIERPAEISGRHILLVDDVMTTGATLEGCARLLLDLPGVRISLATLAIAQE